MFHVTYSYPDTFGYDTYNVPRSDFFWRVRDCRKRLPTAIKNIQLHNIVATTAKETLKTIRIVGIIDTVAMLDTYSEQEAQLSPRKRASNDGLLHRSRSFQVTEFGTNRKLVCYWIILTCILSRIISQ